MVVSIMKTSLGINKQQNSYMGMQASIVGLSAFERIEENGGRGKNSIFLFSFYSWL